MLSRLGPVMCKGVIAILSIIAINSLFQTSVRADDLGGSATVTSPIPDQLQGLYPIHVPKLDGVEQLLVLSDRWVIVVSNKMDELFTEIDKASDGKLSEVSDKWMGSKERGGRPAWGSRKESWRIRDKYVAKARESIGERRLGETDFFTIESPGDDHYNHPVHPTRADRLLVSAGQSRTTGGVFKIDYHIYSYLKLPTPLQQGEYYKITLGDGTNVSFVFDRKSTVSRAIKVNQLGYLPDAGQKRAYIGAYLYRFGPLDLSHVDRFDVINVTTGEVAFNGAIKLLEANPRFAPRKKSQKSSERPLMYGEDVYVADFTELKDEGIFFISVPGVGRSWPFRHSSSVYGPAFYTTARGLYHQRAGTPITKKYTPWARQKALRGPYCESEHIYFPMGVRKPKNYKRFDVIGGSIDCSSATEEIPGGWHDAADWDSNEAHYTVVFDLLNAFAFYPERFADGQLNLPESGNGVPDILDEARFGLEIWRHSMDERGGVSGMLETWTHPNINSDIKGRGPSGFDKARYAFSQRTRWSSLVFAAAAAQYAQLVQPFDSKNSALYREVAVRAYNYGNDMANSLGETVIHARTNRGRGDPYTIQWAETEEHIRLYLLYAKLRLYLLTNNNTYLDGVWQLSKTSKSPGRILSYRGHYYKPWIYYSLLEVGDALPELLSINWRHWFIENANKLIANIDKSPYSVTWPRKQDYWLAWGASDMTNFSRALFIAYKLTANKKYRDAAILNADFMLGANPMGMAWTTGIGFVYPIDIQHGPSGRDRIFDPVPGISIYGITGAPIYRKFRETVWQSLDSGSSVNFVSHETQLKPPLWRRWMAHPSLNVNQNEFTIQETMSSTIFTSAMLLPDNWLPDKALLERKPRAPDILHGRWYLP